MAPLVCSGSRSSCCRSAGPSASLGTRLQAAAPAAVVDAPPQAALRASAAAACFSGRPVGASLEALTARPGARRRGALTAARASSARPVVAAIDAPPRVADYRISYELVQGSQVRWSPAESALKGAALSAPPTAVLMHGILGSRRNLLSFAKKLAAAFPAWQFLLVDLRCHGQSAAQRAPGEHSVASAAQDVLQLLRSLRLFPQKIIGHSFGGKVAMSMAHQFGRVLPRQVQVWVLDTVPGDVYAEGGDHPRDVIQFVRTLRMPLGSRKELVDALTGRGFTLAGAQWMTTNLTPTADGRLDWTFDIQGISQMYATYEESDLWPLVENPPQGALIEFVRAENSAFLWSDADVNRILAAGARVHLLRNSGHWVHIDAPDGLVQIMAPSFA